MKLNTPLWNFSQFVLAKLRRPPMNCWCKQCEPGQTYECEGCQKEQPYCRGQDDGFFELCDDCWFEQTGGLKTVTAAQQTLEDLFDDQNE